MENEKVLITEEGLQKLKDELEYLTTQKRKEIAEKIKIARGFGDLSENSEYDEAKAEQLKVENRIIEIQEQLKNVQIIENKKSGKSKTVGVGDTVTLLETSKNREMKFTIVGTVESDISKGKISNESPVGKAVIGHKKGQAVEVTTKVGVLTYKIVDIG